MNPYRVAVRNLYKNLLYRGKDYPKGYTYFRDRCHSAFKRNLQETDPATVKQLIARGDFVIKELEALYMLRKYRFLKNRYYNSDKPE